MMTEIKKLQREIHEINASKGWHPEPLVRDDGSMIPDRVLAKLALIHTELSEADAEAVADRFEVWYETNDSWPGGSDPNKPEGYVVEIADALIRALDLCEAIGVTIDPELDSRWPPAHGSLRMIVDAASEAVRVGRADRVREALSALWVECHWITHGYGLDLDAAIRLKMDYNRTRSFRHGEKLA